MSKIAAGLLMFRRKEDVLEVFLVHHGGPFFKDKDNGFWSLPKGHVKKDEDLLQTAKREFKEETGINPKGNFFSLGKISCGHGKTIHAWAFENDWNGKLKKNMIKIEYPKGSGKKITIPEIDKVEFFSVEDAELKIEDCQIGFVKRLERILVLRKLLKLRKEFVLRFKKGLSFVFKNRNLNSN